VDLNIRESGNICTLTLKGRMVCGESVSKFEKAFRSSLLSGHIYLVIDLESVPFMDSSGIGTIVNALRMSSKAGGSAKLVKPAPFVTKTFKVCGILDLFTVYETEAEAVAAYPG
jgi:anti-sigma B factor antagonist